jgi:hypothetical protein
MVHHQRFDAAVKHVSKLPAMSLIEQRPTTSHYSLSRQWSRSTRIN